MDVLSDVLNVIRLNGGGFLTAEFSAPWAVFSPPPAELARLMATKAESIALFHILVEGECWITLKDQKSIKLTAGSAVIFPHSPSHNMGSDPHLTPEPIVPLLTFSNEKEIPEINHGGKGSLTRLVCGYLKCEQRFNPLIGALPSMLLVIPGKKGRMTTALSKTIPIIHMTTGDWLQKTLSHTVEESLKNKPGCAAMLARLTELCYVEVLRRYIQQQPATSNDWLTAVNDPEIGRALRLLHAEPKRKWTVEELAHAVGRSRSALAERFTDLVGASPMQYLTNWRMQMAKDFILKADLSLLQIAEEVGYESQAAFSRAFKRHNDDPPSRWREKFLNSTS